VSALLLGTASAAAQTSEGNRIAAETLFNEAKKLMGERKYDEACPKFADSQRLDPGVGTLLNLARCYKEGGKTASAWSTYRDAAAAARVAGQGEREEVARQEASALEPQLAKLVLKVAGPVEALEIKLDGSVVPKSLWTIPMPVDPGEHAVQASAAGYKPWSGRLEASAGSAATLEIPALEADPTATAATDGGGGGASLDHGSEQAKSSGQGQRTIALIAGGVGVVGIGLGTYFGLSAKSRYGDSDPYCNSSNGCSQTGLDIRDEAIGKATISTIAFGVGAAALVGGVVLWFTAPSKKPAEAAQLGLRLAPSADGWRASVGARW
jgi:hypothetical protein